jgi:hypothetical protein
MASCARSAIDKPVDERPGDDCIGTVPSRASSQRQGRKIDGWGSAVLGRVAMVRLSLAMVRLSLASPALFCTLKEKVMLKLTVVLSGIAVGLTGR